ncbi:hypothetical protein D0Q02_15755 [Micromonospora craniellae]|uniref:Uncharacterized protein n=1 Tax=Micromonospora craniellae TaxID=2294034 RepID=A0A372FXN0_9ACTN|nr:hypothetical protein D0Q02_15755 [Micromonospora craniellae]
MPIPTRRAGLRTRSARPTPRGGSTPRRVPRVRRRLTGTSGLVRRRTLWRSPCHRPHRHRCFRR